MDKVYGIDLGTTYSCIAYIDENGKPVVLKNIEGALTTPSVVHFESDSDIHVGEVAKESSKLYPEQVVSFIKQNMGEPDYTRTINGKELRPEEISAYILKKVVDDAKTTLEEEQKLEAGEEIKNVVITCPAYFGVAERAATEAAGRIAGLNILEIINEPTAAAIAYGTIDDSAEKTVLVYDLGGGTFDVTIIRVTPGEIRVICTGGDKNLGGKDWDECILQYLSDEYQRETGSSENILADEETLQELFLSVERAKKLLSTKPKAPISINYKGERVRVELTREKFDELTKVLLDRTIELTREMFAENKEKVAPSDVTEILLVGGSSKMPQVMERVKDEFGIETKMFDPDEAVAKGAAIRAANRQAYDVVIEEVAAHSGKTTEELKEEVNAGKMDLDKAAESAGIKLGEIGGISINATKIINVTSRSFGVKVLTGNKGEVRLNNLIFKNSELPVEAENDVSPAEDHQGNALIEVMENLSTEEMIDPELGRKIGEAVLELPSNSTSNDTIKIIFRLNESGLLEVRAVDLKSGNEVEAQFQITDALSEDAESSARLELQSANVD